MTLSVPEIARLSHMSHKLLQKWIVGLSLLFAYIWCGFARGEAKGRENEEVVMKTWNDMPLQWRGLISGKHDDLGT